MASSVTVKVVIDEKGLNHAVNYAPGTKTALEADVKKRVTTANSMAAGYRTPKWHDHETGETKGDTQAKYGGGVKLGRKGYVGIVHPVNYAAMKENHAHNTLLKVKG